MRASWVAFTGGPQVCAAGKSLNKSAPWQFGGSSGRRIRTLTSTNGGPDSYVETRRQAGAASGYVTTDSDSPGSAGGVSMYAINASTGVLTSIGLIATGTDPAFAVVDPTGKFA
jgi:hypothetical protein